MSEPIPAYFDPPLFENLFVVIKHYGIKTAEKEMIAKGFHPSFVKAAIKRIMRTRGW